MFEFFEWMRRYGAPKPDVRKRHHGRSRRGQEVRPVVERPWTLQTARERLEASTPRRSLVTDNEKRRALRQDNRGARLSKRHIPEWKRLLREQGRREKAARKAAAQS